MIMKSLRLLTLGILGIVLLNSCKTKECETNNFGSVSITNNLNEDFSYDVVYEKDSNDTWLDNYEVEIKMGQSYTWNEVAAGDIRILLGNNNQKWIYTEDSKLSACEDKAITYENQCELLKMGNAIVVNETEWQILVEIQSSEGFIEEIQLGPNEQVTYLVIAGDIRYWARTVNSDKWSISDLYALAKCDEFTFTWTPDEFTTYKKMAKPLDAKQYQHERAIRK